MVSPEIQFALNSNVLQIENKFNHISGFLHKKFFLLTCFKLMLISVKYKAKYQFGFVPA